MFMRFRPQGVQNVGQKSTSYVAFRFNSIHPQVFNTSYSGIVSEISTGQDPDVDKRTWLNKLFCTVSKVDFPTSRKRH